LLSLTIGTTSIRKLASTYQRDSFTFEKAYFTAGDRTVFEEKHPHGKSGAAFGEKQAS
jgi:hypothetical protein